jgi:hypothetical protein
METRRTILTISDLSDRSDPAVRFAGYMAHLLTADLHMLHAMSLAYRPLRAVVPALNNMDGAIRAADVIMRAHMRRVVPPGVVTGAPVIDLDDPTRAVARLAAEIEPWVVISPPMWDWRSNERRQRTSFRAAFTNVPAPVLVIKEQPQKTYGRVIVVSHSATVHGETIESAGRWAFWLDHAYRGPVETAEPDFEVVLVDEARDPASIAAHMDSRADLIVIDPAMLLQDDVNDILDVVMPVILQQSLAPVALLKAISNGGGGHGIDDSGRFATNSNARQRSIESDGIAAA